MSILLIFSGGAGEPDWDRPLAPVFLLEPLAIFVGAGENVQHFAHELPLLDWTQSDKLLCDVLGHLVQQHVLDSVLATQLLVWLQ